MDELKNIAQQFVQAAQINGPSSYIPEVQKFGQAGSIASAIARGLSGSGALAGQRGKEADEADEAARQAQMRQLSDKLDPSKYRRVRSADGGFEFFDPSGKKINIDQYAQITGQRLVDVLKDSENPTDLEYVNDWSNMNTLMQAVYNGDAATATSFLDQNPSLKGVSPQNYGLELVKKYPHLYRAGSYGQTVGNRGKAIFSYNPDSDLTSTGSSSSGSGWSPS